MVSALVVVIYTNEVNDANIESNYKVLEVLLPPVLPSADITVLC